MKRTIYIFGDSIAYGAYDPHSGGWATLLQQHLKNSADIYNMAQCGENTQTLVEKLQNESALYKADITMFAIGINDSRYTDNQNETDIPLPQFHDNIEQLIRQGQSFTHHTIFMGITKVDDKRAQDIYKEYEALYKNENIKEYNSVLQNICVSHKIPYIDVYDLLESSDLDDGLHPNSDGHKKLFKMLKRSELFSAIK